MINLKTLEAFFWIVELGGFRKAAEKLNTTQPAISARIAQMEEELNTRLLDRNQGSTVPTAKGAELLAYARRMLDLHSEMLASISEPAVTRGTVRMGASEAVACSWLPGLMADLAKMYQLLNFEIEVDSSPNLHTALLGGQLDLAFLDGPVKQPYIENVSLDVYGLSLVASPHLPLKEPLTLESLAPWPLITFGRTTSGYMGMAELQARADRFSVRIYSVATMALAVRLVSDAVGIALLPAVALNSELDSGQLRILQWPEALPIGNFTASYRKGPGARVVSAIANLASSCARQWRNAHPDRCGAS